MPTKLAFWFSWKFQYWGKSGERDKDVNLGKSFNDDYFFLIDRKIFTNVTVRTMMHRVILRDWRKSSKKLLTSMSLITMQQYYNPDLICICTAHLCSLLGLRFSSGLEWLRLVLPGCDEFNSNPQMTEMMRCKLNVDKSNHNMWILVLMWYNYLTKQSSIPKTISRP